MSVASPAQHVWRASLVALTALLAWAAPASANPLDAFGYGARASAMGGAQTAASEDVGAIYYNPALLARFESVRIDIGYQFALPSLMIDGQDVGNDTARGTTAGVVIPGKIGPVELALGAAFYIPDQYLMRLRSLPENQPRFVMFDNRPQRMFMATTLSGKLGSRAAVGIGYGFFADTVGGVDLQGRVGFPNAEDSDLNLGLDVDLREIRYLHAGAGGLCHRLARHRRQLPGRLRHDSRPGAAHRRKHRGQRARSDRGGCAGPPCARCRWTTFNRNRSPSARAPGFARISSSHSTSPITAGRSSKTRPPTSTPRSMPVSSMTCSISRPAIPLTEVDFDDIIVPRLGVEWMMRNSTNHSLFLRGGYSYEPSPAAEQRGNLNLVDNDKHTASVGGGHHTVQPQPLPAGAGLFRRGLRHDANAEPITPQVVAGRRGRRLPLIGSHMAAGPQLQVGILAVRSLMMLCLVSTGCGFGPFAGEGGGRENLPVRGAGFFKKLAIDFDTPADEPYLIADNVASMSDAAGLWRPGGGVRLWFTRTEDGASEIWRAEIESVTEWPDVPPAPALQPDLAWEQGFVGKPTVVEDADGGLVMYYQGGVADPAIGRAISDNGVDWTKDAEPMLTDAGAPSAGRFDDRWFLAYTVEGEDGIFFAESDDGRSFAQPTTVVQSRPDVEEAFDSDGVLDPGLTVSTNTDGTPHFGVVFTGVQPPENEDPPLTTIGYAGSYDGTTWERALEGEPILHEPVPGEGGPSLLLEPGRALLLFHEERVAKLRIGAAVSP